MQLQMPKLWTANLARLSCVSGVPALPNARIDVNVTNVSGQGIPADFPAASRVFEDYWTAVSVRATRIDRVRRSC